MTPQQELFNNPEAWTRFTTYTWSYLDGIPPTKQSRYSPPALPCPTGKSKSPLSFEVKYYIATSSKESFSDEAGEKFTALKEKYSDGVPPKNDSFSEQPNPHIAGNSRYTHEKPRRMAM